MFRPDFCREGSTALSLRIHSIETLAAQDGPGLRMVVFTQGCPLRCAYCHNPDTLSLTGGRLAGLDELVRRAVSQKRFFGVRGGVTVSGGEPTLHAETLREFFRALHDAGISTCLDTNGCLLNDAVKSLYAETDLLLLDIKHIDDAAHRHLTGHSNAVPLAAAAWRERTGKPQWLRYVLVPGWTDHEDHLRRWAEHFSRFRTVERVEVLPYHTLGAHKWKHLGLTSRMDGVKPPTPDHLARVHTLLAPYFRTVVVK